MKPHNYFWLALGVALYLSGILIGAMTTFAATESASYLVLARGGVCAVLLVVFAMACFERSRP